MNSYEHTLIARQDLQESHTKKLIEKYHNLINKFSGKVIKTEEWGLKNLAYEIKKSRRGFYVHIKFDGNGETVQELENAQKIDEMLIRFLTVKVKKHNLEINYFDKKETNAGIEKKDEKK
tara:strand:+ start:337 stop:696 length:360 start_codon:yes stop_codon:yes gene_type:complete